MKHLPIALASSMVATVAASAVANAAQYSVSIVNLTSGMHFTPVIVAAHSPSVRMFSSGSPATSELQAIAEGGNTGPMNTLLESVGASIANGDGLVAPGQQAEFTVDGSTLNSVLSLSTMLLPTNDGFAGLSAVPLHDGPSGSSMTYNVTGYDAGTEANDELVGSGAPGAAGFPAPPPVVATGTGTGGTGIPGRVEGFVHIHKPLIGDLDDSAGVSDINSAVHGWLNPVARVTITKLSDDPEQPNDAPSAVGELSGQVYSSTALEIFWQPALSSGSAIAAYEISRNGELVSTRDALSFFEEGLDAGTEYTYSVTAIDNNGVAGPASMITLTTNDQ